jgi:exopolysaccharide production protein ExoQ
VLTSNSVPVTAVPWASEESSGSKREKPSAWLWVPWVWLLFAATRQPARWLLWYEPVNYGAEDVASGSADRVVMSLLMAIGIFALSRRSAQAKRILASNKWIVLLFAYMALSIVWSNFPATSLVRFIRTFGALEMVLVVLTERYPVEAEAVMLRRLYLVHIPLSAIAIRYVRNIGVFYDWSGQFEDWIGLTTDKNSLGQVAMCSAVFWTWQLFQDWPKRKLKGQKKMVVLDTALLGLTLWILHGSKNVHSSTAIIGCVVCVAILVGLQLLKSKAAKVKLMITLALLASIVVVPLIYLGFESLGTTPLQTVVEATGRDMTFTDRNLIWTDVLNNAKKSPMLGVGVGALWVGPSGYAMYPMPNWSRKTPQWRPEEAHNGYIDTYAQLGVVGLILLAIVIVRAVGGALTTLKSDFQFGSLRLALLVGILLVNMTETSFFLGTHDLWFLFLLLAIDVPVRHQRAVEAGSASNDPAKRREEYRGHDQVVLGRRLPFTRFQTDVTSFSR